MEKKFLILIGRTFIATFILVNFFNTIPINFGLNAWYVAVTMLLVDTASLMLLGLASLKIASFLSINDRSLFSSDENTLPDELDLDKRQKQKYQKNLSVINKVSNYSRYLFIFVALIQIFVIINGLTKLEIDYSERIIILENKYELIKNKTLTELQSNAKNDLKNVNKYSLEKQLVDKDKIKTKLKDTVNKAKFLLIKNSIKVILMSLVWSYGFFKLSKFT